MKILIVDDEQVVADLLSSVLSLHFPEALIRAVYGGEEAIVDAVGERPDAAIFDLDMSGMDGEEAATALRDLFKDAPPQLIALSGNLARLGELRRKGPFDHVLNKAANISALVDLLTRRLR